MPVTEIIPESVRAKIVRAIEHLKALDEIALGYLRGNPGEVVRQGEPNPYGVLDVIPRTKIPLRFPLIVGDALQNLRSSLDYLVWELVLIANNQPSDKNQFPICKSPEAFEEELRRHRLDGVSPEAITEIERLQPYHDGQRWEVNVLYVLNHFCNVNKHRRILLTELKGSRPRAVVSIDGITHFEIPIGSANHGTAGIHLIPVVEEQMHMEDKVLAFIAFNERPAQDLEVSLVLGNIFGYMMDGIMPRFEKFFRQS